MLAGAMPTVCAWYGTRMQSEPLAMLSSGADEAHWPQSWVVGAGQAVGIGFEMGIGVRLHAELGE